MIALAVDRLRIERGGATLLDGVGFEAAGGAFIGIIGPNGAGKTTLLRAIAGLARPSAGAVAINGSPVGELTATVRARLLAYLPQARETNWAMTAEAVASLGRFAWGRWGRLGPADRAAVDRALAATDSDSFRRRVASTLSGGEQARVHLARALAAEAPMLVADEPTAALDLKHAHAIAATLRRRADEGGLVLAALHDLHLAARNCTRLIALDSGRIAADGAPAEILDAALLERVFGVSPDEVGGPRP